MSTLIAKVEGSVVYVGSDEFDGKSYPFFQIQQVGPRGAQTVKISGNGQKIGDKFASNCQISVNDKGRMKIKKIDEK